MKIESTDQEIRTLLSSGYYRIPRFQRPYSWTRENIQEFWDDIVKDRPTDYFIGSMVVFKDGNQRFGVVDGQQRLTTITLLLAVLRNTLDTQGFNDLAQGIHGLIERKNIDNKPEFILSTETSYPFFQDHILKWGAPDVPVNPLAEEQNLQSAFDQLTSLVGDVITSQSSDPSLSENKKKVAIKQKLTDIRDALLNLKVICVKLDDEDDAYIIFETLNTRGKDLSLTDLVKNHVNKHLKTKSASIDQTKVKWQRMLETIQAAACDLETDSFLHHFWLSRYDYLSAKTLYKTLKRRITKAETKAFLDSLVSDASLYRMIHEVTFGKWPKQDRRIPEALNALQLFRVKQQTPCVLSLLRSFKGKTIKKRHLEDALVAIEKFHFLFTAVTSQRSSGGISEMYASLGRRLFESHDLATALSVIKELKEKLRDRVPVLGEFKALFPQIVYTDEITKQRALVKYILVGFDKAKTTGTTIDYDSMTIEHLVPQSCVGTGDFTEGIVGQLGNLILLSGDMNSKLGDKSFKEKKKILRVAGFVLPTEIASATDWTAQDIEARTQVLADRAYTKVWKI
ncbi:MAG: DUF262 domain-containing protein [Gammaproteobacteria bacterium]|nr:MAG: DUF262 domain-containing protein [Gammaproteobacteria bacterium]